jgi:hypothetical protein
MPQKPLPPDHEPGTVAVAQPPREAEASDRKQLVYWQDTGVGGVLSLAASAPEGSTNAEQLPLQPGQKDLGTFYILKTTNDAGEEAALSLCATELGETHYTAIVDKNSIMLTPGGQVLFVLLKNRLSPELLDAVRPIVRKAARSPVAGGNRGDAAGTKMLTRTLADGGESNMKGVPRPVDLSDKDHDRLNRARHGDFGFAKRGIRGGQVYPCRLTAYDGALPEELELMGELARDVADAFRDSIVKHRWEAQFKKASQTPPAFLLRAKDGPTPFTTITCNKSWQTFAHIDGGDLKEGFGAMCCLGDFEGCDLVFPRYKVAVRYREGDVLLADVANQVHGNTPLLNPDDSVPLPHRLPERLACIFYYQEGMHNCLPSIEEENEHANNREPGDPIWTNQKDS